MQRKKGEKEDVAAVGGEKGSFFADGIRAPRAHLGGRGADVEGR